MTASASEVFIAALTHHGAAVTVGRPTFGKGLVQETFPASDGGIFIITTGELLAPDNKSFNNKGLPPRLPLRDSGRDQDYYDRTKEAFTVIAKIMTGRATGHSQSP
jgi:carboxyl-terminal processing protease